MRFRILEAAVVGVLAAGCASAGRTSSATEEFCRAPLAKGDAHGVDWGSSANAPDPASVGARLAGTWDVWSVTTLGDTYTNAEHSVLRLVAVDSAARTRCPFGPCFFGISFPAAGSVVKHGLQFDSAAAAQRKLESEDQIDAIFDRNHNSLELRFGPPRFDAGIFYDLTELSDSTFAGRWEDGSLVQVKVIRRGVETYESPQGYFCARKRTSR